MLLQCKVFLQGIPKIRILEILEVCYALREKYRLEIEPIDI